MFFQKVWYEFGSVILVVIGAYFGLIAILTIFQSNFIYFPSKDIDYTPQDICLKYESVSIQTQDGTKISGWFIPSDRSRGAILFCHGNAGNISHRLDSIRIFNRLNLDVFIFDYHGYGLSGGSPGETETYQDADAAWKYLTGEKNIPPEKIVVFGRSLGGVIATHLAQKYSPGALIVESGFSSAAELGKDVYPFIPVKMIIKYDYNAGEYIKNVKSPVFIIHSPDDEIIPFKHGEKIFKNANEPKKFLEIIGSHNEGFAVSGNIYIEGLSSFLDEVL